ISVMSYGEMNNLAETLVGHRNDGRILTGNRPCNRIETQEVDRLAADLGEVTPAPKNAEESAVDLAEVIRDEPSVDLRIDESVFRPIAGEERWTAKREPAVLLTPRLQMREQRPFDSDRRATFAHSVRRQHGPSESARLLLQLRIERSATDENRAQTRWRRQP